MPTSKRLFRAASYALCLQVAPRFLAHSVSRFTPLVSLSFALRFLYIGESRTGHEYILIRKDDFSGYVF